MRFRKRLVIIPKHFELCLLGACLSRYWRQLNGDKYAFDGFGGSVFKSMLPLIGEPSQVFGGAGPIINVWKNIDAFRGRDIIPSYQRELILSQRTYKSSSDIGKAVGETMTKALNAMGSEIQVDPRQVDHLIRGYTTYWGQMMSGAVDMLTGSKYPKEEVLLMTGLIKNTPVWGSRDVQRSLELFAKYPLTVKYRAEFMEYLKLYAILPEGDQKEALKHTIFDMATAIRTFIEVNEEEIKKMHE